MVRSRSIVIEVTRNIEIKREDPDERQPDALERPGNALEHVLEEHDEGARDDDDQRQRANVAPELAEHALCGRDDDSGIHAGAVSDVRISRRNASSTSRAPVRSSNPAGESDAQDPPVAHQQQAVAAFGLVHDVARDEQRRARLGERAEALPELEAQHGVEADRWLVEHEQLRPAEQRGRERHPRAAGRPRAGATRSPAMGRQADRLDHVVDLLPARPSTRAKYARFSRTVRSP